MLALFERMHSPTEHEILAMQSEVMDHGWVELAWMVTVRFHRQQNATGSGRGSGEWEWEWVVVLLLGAVLLCYAVL